jgi:hypothetical protein
MGDKIDEILRNERFWKKEKIVSKEHASEPEKRDQREEKNAISAFIKKLPTKIWIIPIRKGQLGGTGPKPQFDSWPQGGNAYPRNRRREHPSGYHSCG